MSQLIRLLSSTLICTMLITALVAPIGAASEYLLRTGDSLNISVVGHPDLMVPAQPIRPDGHISLPMIAPLRVEGRSIAQVTASVQEAYRSILTNPRVLVSIAQFRPLRITVLGKVERAGSFDFTQPPTLIEAIATAGGLNRRAARNAITVVEPGSTSRRTYDLDRLLQGKEAIPTLAEGGIVEVGEVWGPDAEVWIPLIASLLTAVAFVKAWD
jgi:protein involved in polysaccharide export with SLBB domain